MIVTRQVRLVDKPYEKRLYILSNFKIKNTFDFINLDIPTCKLNGRNCVLGFYNNHHIYAIKQSLKHPYVVSEVFDDDLFSYCSKSSSDALILNDGYCDLSTYETYFEGKYYMYEEDTSINNVFMFERTLD